MARPRGATFGAKNKKEGSWRSINKLNVAAIVVVALLLNIYVFLWNVKAHESAKTRRSRANAAGKKRR